MRRQYYCGTILMTVTTCIAVYCHLSTHFSLSVYLVLPWRPRRTWPPKGACWNPYRAGSTRWPVSFMLQMCMVVCVWVWKPTVGYEIPAVPSDINAHICFLYNGKWLFVVKIHGDVPGNRWVIIWLCRVQIMQECLNKELQQFVILVMKKTLSDKCFTYPHCWFMLALCFIMSMLSL